jgi:hypothetical protein
VKLTDVAPLRFSFVSAHALDTFQAQARVVAGSDDGFTSKPVTLAGKRLKAYSVVLSS